MKSMHFGPFTRIRMSTGITDVAYDAANNGLVFYGKGKTFERFSEALSRTVLAPVIADVLIDKNVRTQHTLTISPVVASIFQQILKSLAFHGASNDNLELIALGGKHLLTNLKGFEYEAPERGWFMDVHQPLLPSAKPANTPESFVPTKMNDRFHLYQRVREELKLVEAMLKDDSTTHDPSLQLFKWPDDSDAKTTEMVDLENKLKAALRVALGGSDIDITAKMLGYLGEFCERLDGTLPSTYLDKRFASLEAPGDVHVFSAPTLDTVNNRRAKPYELTDLPKLLETAQNVYAAQAQPETGQSNSR